MNRLHYLAVGVLLILTTTAVAAYQRAPSQSDQIIYLPLVSHLSGPQIISFQADPDMIYPGQTVTISWEAVHADQITLTRYEYRPFEWWTNLPMSGAHIYTPPAEKRNPIYFGLEARNSTSGISAWANLTIAIICPDAWFFAPAPDGCPAAPLIFPAIEQPFENGSMIWLGNENRILILFDDDDYPQLSWFDNGWDGGSICDSDFGDPPEGYFHPEGILGYLWCENDAARERLGWGVEPEVAYETILQEVRIQYYQYLYHIHTYLLAADGNVWHLFPPPYTGWEKIIVD